MTALSLRLLCLVTLLLGLAAPLPSLAQTPASGGETAPATPAPEVPPDPLGRRTPQGTVTGYIAAVAEEDYDKAARFLDIEFLSPGLRAARGPELARRLQVLLDQRGTVQATPLISNKPEGTLDDEAGIDQDRVGVIRLDEDRIPVLVKRVEDEQGHPIWLFSAETLLALPDEEVATATETPLERFLPTRLKEHKWGGVPVGHWLAMLALAAVCYLIAWLVTTTATLLVRLVWKRARDRRAAKLIKALAIPVRLYLAVWLFVYGSQRAGVSIVVRQYFAEATVVVAWLAILILCWRLIDVSAMLGEQRMYRRNNAGGLSAILFFRRSGKFILVAIGIITILDTIGLEVATWLAALGIGGLALALGAQKTVENLVGSLTVIFDQPVRVGDYCKVGVIAGTVENIGMRSTRLRTLDRTVVTIPNGYFSDQLIENYAHRDRFLMNFSLNLRYDTSPDQIRWLLVELRALLYAHPKVNPDPARVRFAGFAESTLRMDVFAYLDVADFEESLQVKEDIYLHVMEKVEESGTALAYPSHTLYLGRDGGVSETRREQIRRTVEAWREQGEMQLPKFDPERIQALRGTLRWPPEGSSSRPKDGNG